MTHHHAPGHNGPDDRPTVRVLVVDDDFMVARLHRAMVDQTPGFAVAGEARTGAEALTAVRALRPDLLLLDIYLPDMSGLDVLRALRGDPGEEKGNAPASPGVDVLVVTAARDVETVRGAQLGGAVHYIIKPFESRTLRERLLAYAQRRRELAALAAAGEAGQAEVDRVFGSPAGLPRAAAPPREPPALPKGLTAQTAALVRRALKEAPGDLSAAECAELSGLSRVSARRYLEHFAAGGEAEVSLRYGTTGRPERRYRLPGATPPRTGRD
ncbi:response regulator [Streptomyces sp. RKND-216]|uniref:response regulator n=1 Tax=Streptomyces sp. RKND-216 TaxID=2562581 RepID=UPI00109DFC57|nr:response regulator [Streptomyces sp. RKND-216]THA26561.1 response regulator [Streptomyces sp. RKND-216]